jgi:hypothetical protein
VVETTVAMAVATVVAITVATVVAITVATAVETLILIILTLINLLEQMGGKIEVMETLLKIQNMRVEEAGEKEASQIRVTHLMKIINNPFLQVQKLI